MNRDDPEQYTSKWLQELGLTMKKVRAPEVYKFKSSDTYWTKISFFNNLKIRTVRWVVYKIVVIPSIIENSNPIKKAPKKLKIDSWGLSNNSALSVKRKTK